MDKQTNVRKLKDQIHDAQASMKEHHDAVFKLEAEIQELNKIIFDQESTFANQKDDHSTRTELVMMPRKGPRTALQELEAESVRFLPDKIIPKNKETTTRPIFRR